MNQSDFSTVAPEASSDGVLKARQPRQSLANRTIAILAALTMFGIAYVLGREVYIEVSGSQRTSWLSPIFDWLANPSINWVLLVVGIAAALLALICLVSVLTPAKKNYQQISEHPQIFIRDSDISRLALGHMKTLPGVVGAHAAVKKNRMGIKAELASSSLDSSRIAGALNPVLSTVGISEPPKIDVRRVNSSDAREGKELTE